MSLVARTMGALLVCTALLAVATPTAAASPRDPRLSQVKDFAFGLGSGNLDGDVAARFAGYDLVVVDGQEARTDQIAALQAQGTIVLGYLSVGTIEKYRPWYRRLKKFRRQEEFEEFDEPFAHQSPGFRRAITRIARRLLGKGFNGLFLDNTDMIEQFKKETRGMRKLVRRLSGIVHAEGKFLFAQNGAPVIGPLLPYYDGWNRESVTWSYNFKRKLYFPLSEAIAASVRAEFGPIGAAGLLTLATDYTAGDQAAQDQSVANACSVGAVPFVSNIELTRLPPAPLSCPQP